MSYPQQPPQYPQQVVYQQVVRPPSNGAATAALILGILAVFFGISVPIPFWGLIVIFLAVPLGALAVIFGHVGMRASRTIPVGRGNAVAGLIMGYVTLAICILTTAFWVIALVGSAASTSSV
ncbi:hypothetical protein [Microbacterium oleivorans]|uniref:hypothetical protein n=1 Tax=Microbacterium oleivorans TaxID=273677 RepID=UPI00080E7CEA|nr:hypothetical protein [Microbacterium oleivorans]